MIVYSDKLLLSYYSKYVTKTNHMASSEINDVDSKSRDYAELCQNDLNYALILSNLTGHEQLMFIRFFEVFLYRIYNVRKSFRSESEVNWAEFQEFIKNNESYEKLFFTCFHFYF